MAFKEITGGNTRIAEYFPKKATERKAGDFVVGVYRGKSESTRPDGSTSVLYLLDGENGRIGVNSSPVIATKLEQIPEGATIKIVFQGKERSAKTGREYNNFSVFVDEDSNDSVDLSSEGAASIPTF